VKLLRLRLSNFKGVRDFVLDAQAGDVTVYGDNATGKTTLVDAFMWLLFDKDSANRKDFEIKTLGEDGQPIHNLEHEVEAELELADRRRLTLRKAYQEKWTKRRGQAHREFAGHTTDHYIDGVPVKKSEYDALIADIADEKLFRLLTDPTFFNEQMHWQERRSLLLEVCGDVTDEDVIASDPALADLPAILGGRRLDDHRKVVLARRREINQELERIPVRIDEVGRGLPELPSEGRPALEARLADLRARRAELEQERARIESGGQIAELQRRLAEAKVAHAAAVRRVQEAAEEAVRGERQHLRDLEDHLDEARRRLQRMESQQREAEGEVADLERRIQEKRAEWHQVNAETLQREGESTCPACGQELPEERVREARERAEAEFNESKARRLEEIQAQGKAMHGRPEQVQAAIQEREATIREAALAVGNLESQVMELRQTIEQATAAAPEPDAYPEVRHLSEQIASLEAEIASLQQSNAAALADVTERIRGVDAEIQAVEAALGRMDQHERGLARIAELEAQEKALAEEFERLERELHLCDLFMRAKVKLLTDRINSRFRLARFKLFDVQVNGGISETCETTLNGVPYGSMNNGGRIQVGLDIIETLGAHCGFRPPIFIDTAESVTDIPSTTAQQIRLVVSAADKSLRVETAATAVKEAV